MEDDLWWEDDLWSKTAFDGRLPSMEDDLGGKRTLDGRGPWIEEDLGWKTTLDRRQPWMEDSHGWKPSWMEGKFGWMRSLDGWWPLDRRQTRMEDKLELRTSLEQVPSQREAGIWCRCISVSTSVLVTHSTRYVQLKMGSYVSIVELVTWQTANLISSQWSK